MVGARYCCAQSARDYFAHSLRILAPQLPHNGYLTASLPHCKFFLRVSALRVFFFTPTIAGLLVRRRRIQPRRRRVAGEVSDGGSRGSTSAIAELSTLGRKLTVAFGTG